MAKECIYCSHEGHLYNQGYWWCELNHWPMDAENCKDFDKITAGECAAASSIEINY